MMTRLSRARFAAQLREELGLDEDKAREYANLIGDDPEIDAEGRVVVRDRAWQVIDRLSIRLS